MQACQVFAKRRRDGFRRETHFACFAAEGKSRNLDRSNFCDTRRRPHLISQVSPSISQSQAIVTCVTKVTLGSTMRTRSCRNHLYIGTCDCMHAKPWTKKEPSSRFAARRTLFKVWYHARSGAISAGQVRSATFALRWSRLIEHDITRGTAFFCRESQGWFFFFVQGSRRNTVRRLTGCPPLSWRAALPDELPSQPTLAELVEATPATLPVTADPSRQGVALARFSIVWLHNHIHRKIIHKVYTWRAVRANMGEYSDTVEVVNFSGNLYFDKKWTV